MKKVLLLVMVLSAVASCSKPTSYEPFILRENAEYGDTYSYNLDLSDSTATYSLSFYTRLSRKPFREFSADSLILAIRWSSPSDSSIREKAVLYLKDPIDSSYYSKDFIIPFRDNLNLFESGTWRLRVRVMNNPADLCGLGIISSEN